MDNIVNVGFIIGVLMIIGGIIWYFIDSIKSKKIYLSFLELNLPKVAEDIIKDILSDKPDSTSVEDILRFSEQFFVNNDDLYLNGIEYIKYEMLEYINDYIYNTVQGRFTKYLMNKNINIDSQIILDALDEVLTTNGSDGQKMYNKLIKLLTEYVSDTLDDIQKEEDEAVKMHEDYENETVENVADYNGELDKSEYDIARENFQPVGNEYPDEENLDDIPEELVEIIERSEKDI